MTLPASAKELIEMLYHLDKVLEHMEEVADCIIRASLQDDEDETLKEATSELIANSAHLLLKATHEIKDVKETIQLSLKVEAGQVN